MDALMDLLKEKLNDMEDKYGKQQGPNLESKMINYFLRSKEKIDLKHLITITNKKEIDDVDKDENDDDDSVESSDSLLEDDMESLDGTEEENPQDDRCGSLMERFWIKRSIALRTDIAIAGWMCSPHSEIMEDCSNNHTGDHKNAVTRLFTKWFDYLVSSC